MMSAFTSHFTSTPRAFEVITVNMLHKLKFTCLQVLPVFLYFCLSVCHVWVLNLKAKKNIEKPKFVSTLRPSVNCVTVTVSVVASTDIHYIKKLLTFLQII